MFDEVVEGYIEHTASLRRSRELKEIADQCLSDSQEWFPAVAHDVGFSAIALAGEVGEVCNLVKKFERGSITLAELKGQVADELADVFTYFMNMCGQLGIDIGAAYDQKRAFNAERFGKRES